MADNYFTPDKVALLKSLGILDDRFGPSGATYTPASSDPDYDPKFPNVPVEMQQLNTPPSAKEQKTIDIAKQINVPDPTGSHGVFGALQGALGGKGQVGNLLDKRSADNSPQYPNSVNDYGKLTTLPITVPLDNDDNGKQAVTKNNSGGNAKGKKREPALSNKQPGAPTEQKKDETASGTEQSLADLKQNVSPLETTNGLLDALRTQNNIVGMNQVAKGGNRILAALTRTPVDNSDYDKNIELAQGIPKQFAALQQQKLVQNENDPNSAESVAFRNFAQKLGYNAPPNLSAAVAKNLLPALYHSFDVQEATKNRLAMSEAAAAERLQQGREHNETIRAIAQGNNDTRRAIAEMNGKNKTSGAATKQQNDALKTTQQLLESARGNPAAAQAEKDIYAAAKLKDLIGDDPNKLSPAQVQLAASEVSKIAQGGTPTREELRGLTPNTVPSKLASLAQIVTNDPTSARAGEFLKQYSDYADAVQQRAQGILTDKYSRIIEPRKQFLGDDNYNNLRERYINRFKNGASGKPKTVTQEVNGKTYTYTLNPQTGEYE